MKILIMIIYIIFNIILLFSISPIIDHFFKDLDETESETQILFEIISQILVVACIWYLIDKYIINVIKLKLNLTNQPVVTKVREVVVAVIFVGLQKHLIKKLEYIAGRHPLSKLFLTD
jgi:hypothetical protein